MFWFKNIYIFFRFMLYKSSSIWIWKNLLNPWCYIFDYRKYKNLLLSLKRGDISQLRTQSQVCKAAFTCSKSIIKALGHCIKLTLN